MTSLTLQRLLLLLQGLCTLQQAVSLRQSHLIDQIVQRGGMISDALRIGESTACGGGDGIFAARQLTPNAELLSVPLYECISYQDAYHSDTVVGAAIRSQMLEELNEDVGKLAMGVAAMLAYARWAKDEAVRARWGIYVDSLPWDIARNVVLAAEVSFAADASAREADARAVQSTEPNELNSTPSLDEKVARWRREAVATQRGYARGVQFLTGGKVPLEACWQALWLVESRAFDMASFGGSGCVMVPILDLGNHPSQSALAYYGAAGERFAKAPSIKGACMQWSADIASGVVKMHAPGELEVAEGDEIWSWYGTAGLDAHADSLDVMTRRDVFFAVQYGFSPSE